MTIDCYSDVCIEDKTLRPYQQKAKKEIFDSWDEVDSVMFQMPTGTGKTRLFTSIIRDINNYSIRRKEAVKILIIAHRTELIDQIDASLKRYGVPHNIIAGNHKREIKYPVHVASIQTITHPNNLEKAKKLNVQFVIIDEAHHALATTYKKLWKMYPNARFLGVTATPWRMNHQSFTDLFDRLILSMPVKDFINQGYLAPYKYFSLKSDSNIQKTIDDIELDKFGEYLESSMEEKMDIGSIRAQLLDSYLSLAEGKKGIIYAINIVHAKHICKEYEKAGYRAVSIDSKTPAAERKHLVDKFKKGEIDIIVNVDIFSEGFDCPDIEFIQLARPTRSLVKYLQQVGRGLRTTQNKQNCIILDNVGMYSRFGLPNARRHWKQHFLGKKIDETPVSVSVSFGNSGKRRNVDLSEGTEDMELIQDLNDEVEIIDVSKESNSAIDEFFPIFGITLGKTTWEQAEKLGAETKIDEDIGDVYLEIENIRFDMGITEIFSWKKSDCDFPKIWKSKGFSWDNSYDEWINVFHRLGYKIEIVNKPAQEMHDGHFSLSGCFWAKSQDDSLSFALDFDYGEKGSYTSSPNTLYSISVYYKGQPVEEEEDEDENIEDSHDEVLFYDPNGVSYKPDCNALIEYPSENKYNSIEIPSFIEYIRSRAFKDNKASEIIFHDGILELQDYIFKNCQNLTTITIKTNTPDDIKIDPNAFSGFDVGNCVLRVPVDALSTYMDDERFKDFKYITAIEGSSCLMYDAKGKKVVGCNGDKCRTLVIPEGIDTIDEEAFKGNETIVSVHFPNSLRIIGSCAFADCSRIKKISLNDELEEIEYDAFRGTSLKEIKIPYKVKEIQASAFSCDIKVDTLNRNFCDLDGILFDKNKQNLIIYPSNKSAKVYEVPIGVSMIDYFAFEDSCLQSISLPESVKILGTNIFNGCANLTQLTVKVEDPNRIHFHKDCLNGFNESQCKLFVPKGCIDKYNSHPLFKDFLKIEEIAVLNNKKKKKGKTSAEINCVTGQFFKALPEYMRSSSKQFFRYEGENKCYIVMTSKGFYLKVIGGGYYFLSKITFKYETGQVWIHNKNGKLSKYEVSYSTDNKTSTPFGYFTESLDKLSFKDLASNRSFSIHVSKDK